MQVSQIAELDTHAIIGGGQAQNFSMSDSAEFFTVLSDTLYRDKKRAVIRETICNAWDAHIITGITGRPIEITLTADEIIIKDFGPGIADSRIVPIFCVYGASTKVQDENQTGGFGLGSKAPFAYSDHFTVISCHEGFRTVYAISRGGEATDGKPSIRAMVRVPTEETGITVSIPIKSSGDFREFKQIIRSVVYQGGMLARLNDCDLNRIDYTEARKQGFCLIEPYGSGDFHECGIYVLYGTVLYPLTTTNESILQATASLRHLLCEEKKLVLVAQPNTVGVTPSREALSFSELTINTILSLLKRTENALEQKKAAAVREVMDAHVKKHGRYQLSYSIRHDLVAMPSDGVTDAASIMRVVTASWLAREREVPDQHRNICRAATKAFRDSRRVFRRAAAMPGRRVFFEAEAYRHSSRLAFRLATKFSLLHQLHIFSPNSYEKRLLSPKAARSVGLVSPILIIAPSKKKAYERADCLRRVERRNRDMVRCADTFICVILPRSTAEQRAELVAYAAKLKLDTDVLDFTVERRKPAPAQKLFYNFADYNSKLKSEITGAPTLSGAKLFIRATGDAEYVGMIPGVARSKDFILSLYPDIAMALNPKQEEKLRKMGAITVQEQIAKELKQLIGAREVQYDHLMRNGEFIKGANDYYQRQTVPAVTLRLVKTAVPLSKLLFPDRVALGEKAERTNMLLHLLSNIEVSNAEKQPRVLYNEIKQELAVKSRKTFKHLIIGYSEALSKFAHLEILKSADEFDKAKAPELCDLVRFLKRQHQKIQPEPEVLKEAA